MVTTPKLTYQDYANLEGDERYELLNGELILVASPNMDHQEAVTNLGTSLSVFVKERDLGKIYFAPTDVLLTDTVVFQPDLLFLSNEREHIRTPANIQGAPDLIVEVLSPSPSRQDWRDKRELYAEHGVSEYWIVDPTNHIVWVMLLRDGALEVKRMDRLYLKGDTINSPTIGGFSPSLNDIFGGE